VNGFSVLRAIKQDRNIQDIPVLVLTNSLSKKDMVMAYKISRAVTSVSLLIRIHLEEIYKQP
jgi:CheY-like chemotaxis protein